MRTAAIDWPLFTYCGGSLHTYLVDGSLALIDNQQTTPRRTANEPGFPLFLLIAFYTFSLIIWRLLIGQLQIARSTCLCRSWRPRPLRRRRTTSNSRKANSNNRSSKWGLPPSHLEAHLTGASPFPANSRPDCRREPTRWPATLRDWTLHRKPFWSRATTIITKWPSTMAAKAGGPAEWPPFRPPLQAVQPVNVPCCRAKCAAKRSTALRYSTGTCALTPVSVLYLSSVLECDVILN